MATEGPAAAGAVAQIVGRLGHIEPFDESTSDWPSYEERLSSFLQVNRIPEDDKFRQMFPSIKVVPTTLKLRTFDGAIIQPVGVAHVAVQYGEQRAQLPFYVTREKGPPLLGRQWLQAIRLDWSRIFKLNAIPRRLQIGVHQGCLMYGLRVVIPPPLREAVLDELHLGHPGIVRSKELARSYVWWPSIDAYLETKVRSCQACQEQRNDPVKAPLHPWSWPTAPWRRIHLDFAGPFRGTMLLVVVDAHSKWPEVFVMRSTTSERTVACLRELFCRFGVPETVVSDNGPQLVSEEFKAFMRSVGARHVVSAPYHPSTNGLAERFVQTLKSALRKSSPGESIDETLQNFLLAYRNTPHPTTGEAPANLLKGRRLRTRLDAMKPTVEGKVMHSQFTQMQQRRSNRDFFCVNDSVLVRNYRGPTKWVRGTVLKKTGPVSYKVMVTTPRGKFIWRRHLDQLLAGAGPMVTPRASDSDFSEGFLVFPEGQTGDQPTPEEPTPGESIPPAPAPPSETSAPHRRYPSRQRRPPERY
nr:uncharacterized protein K02A2.6-like [Dermacentor andersoni]